LHACARSAPIHLRLRARIVFHPQICLPGTRSPHLRHVPT
jgi:hypothetical protein